MVAPMQTRLESGRQKSRLTAPRHRRKAPPRKRSAGRKHASGFFCPAPLKTHPATVTQTLGTHQENALFLTTTVSGCAVAPNRGAGGHDPDDPRFGGIGSTSTIRVVTTIRPPFVETGMKSTQTVEVSDYTGRIVNSSATTGTTRFLGINWPARGLLPSTGIYDVGGLLNSTVSGFQATSTASGGTVHVHLVGDTGSTFYWFGNIDYNMNVNYSVGGGSPTLTGSHDGFPSYTVDFNGTQIYDCPQDPGLTGSKALVGSGDVIVGPNN